MTRELELPAHGWIPRRHQTSLWRYLESGGTRAVAIWHRRAGKDDVALNWAAVSAAQRIGNYWHMLPEASQARKAIWEAVNPHTGKRRIDEAFPAAIRETTKEQEMFIRFTNGSTWQVVGSDNYDSLVGSAPIGIVFSEWALANPSSWAFLRPILLENGGWALFITTPRGRNHASSFYEGARTDASWYAEKLSAHDTGIFTPAQLEQERREYIRDYPEDGEAKFQQEYECSFAAAIMGAYYGRLMQNAEDEGRIGIVPWMPSEGVWTSWDLGYGDSTVIWLAQLIGGDIRIIDMIAGSGVGIDWYVKKLNEKPYVYVQHIVPHDADNGELGTGERRIDIMRKLGMKPIRVLPRTGVDDGISAVRSLLPRCRFNKATTVRGVEALQQYRKKWDDKNKVFMDTPLHDWASDYADSMRYLAMGIRDRPKAEPAKRERQPHWAAGSAGWMAG
jgi:phage terminase large subunit